MSKPKTVRATKAPSWIVREGETRPRVTITRVADGAVTYSVTATRSRLGQAVEDAKAAFRDLTTFARSMVEEKE